MMRAAINIDEPILQGAEVTAATRGKSLERLVSHRLAQSLAGQRTGGSSSWPGFRWIARPAHARVEPGDRHAPAGRHDGRW